MNLEISLEHYLFLTVTLFFIGFLVTLVKRNILVVLMGVELMLTAVNITFVAAASYRSDLNGQIFAFFNIAIMAAEAGVGLAIVTLFFKLYGNVSFDLMKRIKG